MEGNQLTFGNTKSIIYLRCDGGEMMAKMGRPKVENPTCRVVSVKFKEDEYQTLLEFARSRNLSISQIIRKGIEIQMNSVSK